MNDTNSLFYRLYKSKYFPTGTIFDAKHASGSFAWKSILKARRVILMGARWRVGDGRSISVFNDSWILGLPNGKVISSFSSLDRSISVADLINHDSGCWKVDVIENSFFSFEAQKILAIPLCTSAQHDLVYWPPKKKWHILGEVRLQDVVRGSKKGRSLEFNQKWRFGLVEGHMETKGAR